MPGFGISSGEHVLNVNVNVNVNVGVRVTVSARVSVSVNVCRGFFKRASSRADSRRSVEVDVARAGRAAPAADPGLLGVWPTLPCVWFCLCRPMETTPPTGVWAIRRRARAPGWAVPAGGHWGVGGAGIVRARRDLSNAHGRAQIHAGLSKSMWRGRGGPRSRRREVRTVFGITPLVCGFACAGQ